MRKTIIGLAVAAAIAGGCTSTEQNVDVRQYTDSPQTKTQVQNWESYAACRSIYPNDYYQVCWHLQP